ncbi:MAG: restriction endonuclease subunit S [Nanoarchaeota archaeon]|nr:restriction endonuclease subunit S [Nanoarchaeota archaeon]
MVWNRVKISSFLKERPDRIKPDQANELGLQRLEKINFSGKIHLNGNKPTRTGMILVKKGDLVISGINVEKGAVAVYQGDEDVLATIHYSSYEFDKEKIDVEYFKWFLKSEAFKSAINSQIKGGIKTELKPKKFLPLEIDLPDLDIQIEIRNRLNSVSDEINETIYIQYENDKLLSKLRQAILSEAVQGKLVPQDPNDEPAMVLLEKIKTEQRRLIKDNKIRKEKILSPLSEDKFPFELPNNWVWSRLSEIIVDRPRNGYSPKSVDYKTNVKNLTLSATSSGFFIPTHYKYVDIHIESESYLWLKKGDILIQRSNSRELVGTTAIFNGNDSEFIYPDLMIKVQPIFVESSYLVAVLSEKSVRESFMKKASGTSGTMPKINQSIVSNTLIPIPPLKEQIRIVEKIDQLMQLCDQLESQVKSNQKDSEALMNSVLREAFEVEA